jgi:hypothetical protein
MAAPLGLAEACHQAGQRPDPVGEPDGSQRVSFGGVDALSALRAGRDLQKAKKLANITGTY